MTFRSSCLAGTLVAFGRRAAWRPGAIGVVSSNWLAALCMQLLCSDCEVLGLWLRARFRSSSCLAAGCSRTCVVKSVGGTVQAVAAISDCSKNPSTENGAFFGRQAAWRPGALVDKLCWKAQLTCPVCRFSA